MATPLLRSHKDELTSKLNLALFTETLDDNKDLAARVAHLEAELAGVSLSFHRHEEAMHSLVAAAAAHRQLGQLLQARSCLERASLLPAGDAEMKSMLRVALADLDKKLAAAAPAPAPAPAPKAEKPAPKKPAPKKEEPKAEEKAPEPKAEEPKKEEPKAEEKKPAKKKRRSKKAEEPKAEEKADE